MHYPNPFPMFLPVLVSLVVGPPYIRFLKQQAYGQHIREDGPQRHHAKAGVPTMGGLMILGAALICLIGFLMWKPALFSVQLGLTVLTMLALGALGLIDDWKKITKKHNKGVTGWTKLAVQLMLALILGSYGITHGHANVDFFGLFHVNFGWFYPLLAFLIVAGASNAYNLTDGLDGLAGGTGCMTFLGFAFVLSNLPGMQSKPGLILLCLLLAGGCIGFLIFNRHPAKIFMGDTGSLALGGAMGALAITSRTEFALVLLGGVYVIEALSVILQVISFKTTGKRIFKMSPLHHHFELCGWNEPLIVIQFTALQLILSIAAVLVYNRV